MSRGFKREELEEKKVEQLRAICKVKCIPYCKGKTKLTKKALIDAILLINQPEAEPEKEVKEIEKCIPEECAAPREDDNRPSKKTKDYLEEIEVGMLVCFVDDNDKANTAKVVNVSQSRRVLKLVTQYNREYIVPFADVLWVRTGERWPTFIMQLLKGKQNARYTLEQAGE